MNSKLSGEWKWWKILLLGHLVCYEVFFIFTLANLGYMFRDTQNVIVLFFWTWLLLLHVGTHFYHAGRANLRVVERESYREGLAAAVRQLSYRPDAIDRLALDDEGELVEFLEKPKRNQVNYGGGDRARDSGR